MRPGREWPGVGTGAIVVRDGRLLMVLRAGAHGAGTWSVPGGWVEFQEDPLEGAVREVAEETGVTAGFPRPMGWTSVVHDDGTEIVHALTLWVLCRWIEGLGRVVERDKCPKVEWVGFKEVLDRPLFEPLADWWPAHRLGILDAAIALEDAR